ncbi:MAG: hypothetical protein HKN40_05845 [Winogradskyella sp.]|uniref:hypothetical protein n=1 Tax=Winogradskyella sp. TaxID=1883156 RepID=UPI00180C5CC2|nr:hypothetical protein [Winogradskyella sp.]
MITTVVISALSVLVVIFGYTTYNLMRKNEKQEDIMVSYMDYLSKLDQAIEESDKRLQQIDERGLFKSDDEIGWFFDQVQKIQIILNEFRVTKL